MDWYAEVMMKSASMTKKLLLVGACTMALVPASVFSITILDTGRPAIDAEYAANCVEFRAPGSAAASSARAAATKAQQDEAAGNLNAAMADADTAFQAAATVAGCAPVWFRPPLDGKYNQDIFGTQGPKARPSGPST